MIGGSMDQTLSVETLIAWSTKLSVIKEKTNDE
jgi:hypothetical protein